MATQTASWLSIGELATRAGITASALRFYEQAGLLQSSRSAGGHRQYPRAILRRVAFIRVAQTVGLTLEDIRTALETLPAQRTPTKADWARLSCRWQPLIDQRIASLNALRNQLNSCIGCGCLSLKTCALYNPNDAARGFGAGPRYLLGDHARDLAASKANALEDSK